MIKPDYIAWAKRLLTEICALGLTAEQQQLRLTEAFEAIATQSYWQGKREGREEYILEKDLKEAEHLATMLRQMKI